VLSSDIGTDCSAGRPQNPAGAIIEKAGFYVPRGLNSRYTAGFPDDNNSTEFFENVGDPLVSSPL
jgi:hypothetical protein